MAGGQAVKLGTPAVTQDLYYALMDASWPVFVALVSAAFVALNLLFGLVYVLLPGAIDHARPGSLGDAFFFSIETLATVGYGNMAPATTVGHAVAAIEILTGLFFTATVTGLVFARFARPRASMVFSQVAVIGTYEGGRALMIRLASTRARALADVTAQLGWFERVELPDGRTFGRIVELPLVRSRVPILALSWTLIHPLDDDSAVLAALAGDGRFVLTATIGGLDTLLAAPTFGGHSYGREDVLIDQEFVDIIVERDGVLHLDLSLLHHVRPSAAPSASAAMTPEIFG